MSVAGFRLQPGHSAAAGTAIQGSAAPADVGYVMVDYAPDWSFRQRAQAWLAAVAGQPAGAPPRAFELGGERVLVLDAGLLSARQTIDAFLLVRGDFSCGPGCRFLRPVYIGGNGEIGKGSRLDSVEADGALTLYPSVAIDGWAQAGGEMTVRAGCRISSLASSRTMIRLGLGVEAGRLFAPRIVTPEGIGLARDDSGPTPVESVTIPRPVEGNQAIPFQTLGVEPAKLQPLGAETWIYDGDLCGPWRLWLRAHLVVRGSFCCAANSLLDGDVKAGGALSVGNGTLVRGNLSAAGDLVIGAGCVFQGDIQGQQRVQLGSGVRGFRAGGPVAVGAAGELLLEENVTIRGSLESGSRILSVPAGTPNASRPATVAAAG